MTKLRVGMSLITSLLTVLLSAQIQPSQLRVFQSGTHIETVRLDNFTVRYAISIPKNYSPSEPVPLVLALHYGGSPNGAAQGVLLTLVQPALSDLGAIILAPESVAGAWNSAANEHIVMDLIDAVRASYSIDAKRIAVTGFSMGGTGTWFFAGKYPGLFSAAVPVAGMPPQARSDWSTPVFAVHSADDEVMPIDPTAARIKELQKSGVRAELVTLAGISHSETNRFVGGLRRAVPWLKETWK